MLKTVIFKDYYMQESVTSFNSLMAAADAVIASISEKVMFVS